MPEMALWVAASHRDGLVVNFYSACWKVRPDLFPGQQPTKISTPLHFSCKKPGFSIGELQQLH